MQTLEALSRQIESAEKLQSIVRTMKAMAAANIRQCEEAVESLAGYAETVEMGLQVALRERPETAGLPAGEAGGPLTAVVFGSDQGMVGPFNQRITAYAVRALEREGGEQAATVVAVGQRVATRLAQAGYAPAEQLPLPGSIPGVTPAVGDLLLRIEAWRAAGGARRLTLFYNAPTGGAGYRPQALPLLPMRAAWLAELERRPWPSRSLPTFTMAWDDLFAALVQEHLFVSLFRAYASTMASENASRLAAMQAADKNIRERLDLLAARYHSLRQSAITEELLDVVSGFEALGEKVC